MRVSGITSSGITKKCWFWDICEDGNGICHFESVIPGAIPCSDCPDENERYAELQFENWMASDDRDSSSSLPSVALPAALLDSQAYVAVCGRGDRDGGEVS